MKSTHQRQSGFSLLELTVSVVVVGVIGLLVWRWMAATHAPVERQDIQRQLAEAQAAVEGYVLSHHRLPCPAGDTGGTEACGNANARLLPWKTLGISPEFGRLQYGVNRGGNVDLATAPPAMVSPDLNLTLADVPTVPGLNPVPADVTAVVTRVQTAVTNAQARRTVVNGLDWCRVLRLHAGNLGATGLLTAGNTAAEVPVGYLLVHPGQNGTFDGNNAPGAGGSWAFDLPGRAMDDDFDDLSLAVGPADLSARLGCVARLSEMQAAAQGAFAAYDNARVVQEYWALRLFDIDQAEAALSDAKTGMGMAVMAMALATASTALGIASAANSEGLTAFTLVMAAVNMGMAIVELTLAAIDLAEAEQALLDAKAKLAAANLYGIRIYETYAAALERAVLLDQKGLNP